MINEINELIKCSIDPIYFIENYITLIHPAKGPVQFNLYDYQKDIIKSYSDNKFNLNVTSRQIGYTLTISAYLLWYAIFKPNSKVAIIQPTFNNAKDQIKIISNMIIGLPDWLKPKLTVHNVRKLEFDNGSKILSLSKGYQAKGHSLNIVSIEHLSFFSDSDQESLLESIIPCIIHTNGKLIISSGPHKPLDLFHKLYLDSKSGLNQFITKRYKWDVVPHRDNAFKEHWIRILGEDTWKLEYECKWKDEPDVS